MGKGIFCTYYKGERLEDAKTVIRRISCHTANCWEKKLFVEIKEVGFPESMDISKDQLLAYKSELGENELLFAMVFSEGTECLVCLENEYDHLFEYLQFMKGYEPLVKIGSLPRIYD